MLSASIEVSRRDFGVVADIEVASGRRLALVGPSGSGKSTVLRALAGLVRPSRGRVGLAGTVWLDTERGIDLPPEVRGLGFVFQDYALFPHLSAADNVGYGLRGLDRGERSRRAMAALERFGIGRLAGARPRELSGGECQRVALARALAPEPGLLLLDEPLAALDGPTRAVARSELAVLLDGLDAPAIVVTHDFAEAALLADEVAVLNAGRIEQRGSPEELSSSPASRFVAGFTGAVVLTGVARPGSGGLTAVDLEGGGVVTSADLGEGAVAVTVYPWEIALEPEGTQAPTSAINHLRATVSSVTRIGNRARVGLSAPQPFAAEVTVASADRLGLRPGARVVATFKATATRVVDRRP